jgi:hypothetical protein
MEVDCGGWLVLLTFIHKIKLLCFIGISTNHIRIIYNLCYSSYIFDKAAAGCYKAGC